MPKMVPNWGNSSYTIAIFINPVYVIDVSMTCGAIYITDSGISRIAIFLVASDKLSLPNFKEVGET
jgi:hypothetical protein